MSNAPLGKLVLAGVVFNTLGVDQTHSRARGGAFKAGNVLVPTQVVALLLIDPNEIADPRKLQK